MKSKTGKMKNKDTGIKEGANAVPRGKKEKVMGLTLFGLDFFPIEEEDYFDPDWPQ